MPGANPVTTAISAVSFLDGQCQAWSEPLRASGCRQGRRRSCGPASVALGCVAVRDGRGSPRGSPLTRGCVRCRGYVRSTPMGSVVWRRRPLHGCYGPSRASCLLPLGKGTAASPCPRGAAVAAGPSLGSPEVFPFLSVPRDHALWLLAALPGLLVASGVTHKDVEVPPPACPFSCEDADGPRCSQPVHEHAWEGVPERGWKRPGLLLWHRPVLEPTSVVKPDER